MIRLDPKHLEDLSRRLESLIPESLQSTRAEILKTVRAAVESMLQRLNVVTREEFDVQAQLLVATRERLNELKARLDALEAEKKPEDSVS